MTKGKRYKTIKWEERLRIVGRKVKFIVRIWHRQRQKQIKKNKEHPLKIGTDYRFLSYVERTVGDEKNSLAVALAKIEKKKLQS